MCIGHYNSTQLFRPDVVITAGWPLSSPRRIPRLFHVLLTEALIFIIPRERVIHIDLLVPPSEYGSIY